MKIFTFLFVISTICLNAANITSLSNGNWSNPATWSTGTVPGNNDNVTINHNINLDVSVTTKTSITINSGFSLISETSTLQIKNGVTLQIYGDLQVFDLQFDNGSIVRAENTSTVQVLNNFTNKNNSDDVIIHGYMGVEGNFINSTGGKIIGDGEICTTGSYIGAGDTFGYNPSTTATAGSCIRSATLPVKLISLYTENNNSLITIHWSTATEINNKHFEVLRSINGRDFENIAQINGNGTSNQQHDYSFTDNNAPKTNIYYLLKQVDFDGKYEIFNMLSVDNTNISEDNCNISINPNPCIGKCIINFNDCTNDELQNAYFQIYDISGNVVYSSIQKPIEQGKTSFFLDSSNGLKPAIYIVRGKTNSKNIDKKVIIN